MTETASLHEPPALSVRAILGDAFGALWRHRWVYLGQCFLWSVALLLFQLIVVAIVGLAHGSWFGSSLLIDSAILMAAMAVLLIAGATAIFINIQRAIVLGQIPSLGRGFRLGRADRPVLLAVASYWMVAHLLPTTIGLLLNSSFDNSPNEYADSSTTTELVIAQYWLLVCAVAPLIALAMPIALFEHHPRPMREAWRRCKGMRARMFAITILPILPFALVDFGLAADWPLQPSNLQSRWSMVLTLLLLLGWEFLHGAVPLAVITISSAVVAAIYLRLSPRLEPIHRVFD